MLNQEKNRFGSNQRLQHFYTEKELFNIYKTCACFKNNLEEVHLYKSDGLL